MTTGPNDGKCTNPAGGPGGMPAALRLSEGLGIALRRRRLLSIVTFILLVLPVEVVLAFGGRHDVRGAAIELRLIQSSKPITIAIAESNVVNVSKNPETFAGITPWTCACQWEWLVKRKVICRHQEAGVSRLFASWWGREVFWRQIVVLPDAGPDSRVGHRRRGAPKVLYLDLDKELSIIGAPLNAWIEDDHLDVGALSRYQGGGVPVGGLSSTSGFMNASAGEKQGPKQASSPDEGDEYCKASERDLFLGGAGRSYLGLQVLALTIIGAGFACVSARGALWALDNPNVKGRVFGGALALLGLVGGVTFYGWSAFGHPLRFWCGS